MAGPSNGNNRAPDSEDEDVLNTLQRIDSTNRNRDRLQRAPVVTTPEEPTNFFAAHGMQMIQYYKILIMIHSTMRMNKRIFYNVKKLQIKDRIKIFLRFICSGLNLLQLSGEYLVPTYVIEAIAIETSNSINKYLGPMAMPPLTPELMLENAKKFLQHLSIPNCVAALGVSQITALNYITLDFLMLVDSDGRIIFVDVGFYNMNANMEAGIKMSRLWPIMRDLLTERHPHMCPYLPVVIVGEAFPSTIPNLLNKYGEMESLDNLPNLVFNCRISPAVEVAREALMQLHMRWHIFRRGFPVPPALVARFVRSICILYNTFFVPPVLELEGPDYYIYPNILASLRAAIPENPEDTKLKYLKFFLSEIGEVPWQWQPVVQTYSSKD